MTLRVRRLPQPGLAGPSPVPFLGAAGSLARFFGDPVKHLLALSARGDVVPLARDDASIVCAFGAEHTRTVLSDPARFHNVAEAPMALPATSAAARLGAHNLTSMNGARHRDRRRLVMPMFDRAAVAGYRDAMAHEVAARLPRFAPGMRCELVAEMTDAAIAIAMRCLFGLDGSAAGELGALGVEYLRRLTDPLAMLLPVDAPGTPYRSLLRVSDRLERHVLALIARRRGEPGTDVLSLLIAARDDDGGALADAELVAQAAVFFVAGFETTANTLVWTLLLLAQHPEALAEVTTELDRVLGGRLPEVAELPQLGALDRAIHESMRLLPATPFVFLRRAVEPFELGAQALPAGALVIASPLVAHRDPALYPEPRRFVPARWRALSPGPYAYLPFGAGARRCVGAGFAAQAIRLVLAGLLQQARPVVAPGARVSRRVRGITLGLKHGLPMDLVARDAPVASPARLRGDLHELVDF